MGNHRGLAAPSLLDLSRRAWGQGDQFLCPRDQQVKLGTVVILVGQLRMNQIMDGVDQWTSGALQRIERGRQLREAQGFTAEVQMHEIEVGSVGFNPGAIQHHRRPPAARRRAGRGRIGQQHDAARGQVEMSNVGMAGRDAGHPQIRPGVRRKSHAADCRRTRVSSRA